MLGSIFCILIGAGFLFYMYTLGTIGSDLSRAARGNGERRRPYIQPSPPNEEPFTNEQRQQEFEKVNKPDDLMDRFNAFMFRKLSRG
jgi:hypothetical protein